jgi:hypothetical protein
MYVETHLTSAVENAAFNRRRLVSALRRYRTQVTRATMLVIPYLADGTAGQQALSFTCRIELQARWWGRIVVEASDPNPSAAIGRAIGKLSEQLEAFVSDVPTDTPTSPEPCGPEPRSTQ